MTDGHVRRQSTGLIQAEHASFNCTGAWSCPVLRVVVVGSQIWGMCERNSIMKAVLIVNANLQSVSRGGWIGIYY